VSDCSGRRKHIFELEVAVGDPHRVQMAHAMKHADEIAVGVSLRQRAKLLHLGKQLAALA